MIGSNTLLQMDESSGKEGNMEVRDIELVALTGGPCAGKSSLIEMLKEKEELGGRTLLFVPEAATILINDGMRASDVLQFQTAVMGLQLQLEGAAIEQARKLDTPCAIICDRGTIDGAAYCTDSTFGKVMAAHGRGWEELMSRYSVVVHLVSAAIDAPEAYTTGNNLARFEDLDGAIAQENKTLAVWEKHPNRLVIGGFESFPEKLAAAVAAIETELGKL